MYVCIEERNCTASSKQINIYAAIEMKASLTFSVWRVCTRAVAVDTMRLLFVAKVTSDIIPAVNIK